MLARWKTRFFVAFGSALIALLLLLSSQHRLRLAAGSFQSATNQELERVPGTNSNFHYLSIAPAIDSMQTSQRAIALLAAFQREHPLAAGDAIAVSDDPDTC